MLMTSLAHDLTFQHEHCTSVGTYIRDPHVLNTMYPSLKSMPYVALDTEFIRQNTFFPKLSLIQMAFDHASHEDAALTYILVDAQSPHFEKDIFKPYVYHDTTTYVLHSCRQDLEVLYSLYGVLPQTLFDTQIAAVFLGLGENIAYRALVAHYLGFELDKSQQHTNWAKRPLSPKQLCYATQDVVFLHELYPKMIDHLKKNDRYVWALDEMKSLSHTQAITHISDTRIDRMNIASKHHARMRALFDLREYHAKTHDVNRTSYVSDHDLKKLCNFTDEEQARIFLKDHTQLNSSDQDHFLGIWCQTHDTPAPVAPTKKQQKHMKLLSEYIQKTAHALNLPAHFLGNKRDVYHYVMHEDGRLITTWRMEALEHGHI